jgi:hypothetical protein
VAEPPPAVVSPYLDVEQAATYCHVAVQTLYNHRRNIRAVRSRPLLFRREDLDAWLTAPRRQRRKAVAR